MPLDLAGTGTVYSHGFGECVTYRGAGNMSCLTLTSHWSDEAVTRCRRTVVLHHSSGISIFGNPQPSPGKWKSLSLVWLFVTPWIITHQPPLSLGILQARILEWVAIPSSRGSSQPRARTQVSHITGRFFTVWATREATALFRGCWQTCALCPLERTITLIILRGWQVFPGAGRVWSSSSPGCLWAEDTLDLYSPRMEINRSKLTDGA